MQRNMETASTVDAPATPDQVPPQLFCLRWNNYQSNLTNVFDQLLQNESFVDVTLACGDGHSVKAHKMVLSACSPYFQSLFFENPCRHPIVILKDVKWIELKAAVDFMYKGEINVRQEQIGPLLKVAESLKIRGLADVNNEHDLSSPSDTKIPSSSSVVKERPDSPSSSSPTRPSKRRRKSSPDRSSTEDATSIMNSPSGALELVTSPSSSPGLSSYINSIANSCSIPLQSLTSNGVGQNQGQGQGRAHNPNTPSPPSSMLPALLPPLSLPSTQTPSSIVDDMDIRPGIAEMIREEERAKMLESSQAWLNASASSVAYNRIQMPQYTVVVNSVNSSTCSPPNSLTKVKAPTWTQAQLKEAIQAVVTQRMRFTQASCYYGIPKGTLYDNILGKTKRMQALDEAELTADEEAAVLEFCCQISLSPYNRRTKVSLSQVLSFVEQLKRRKDADFQIDGISGFRWWWAFCKKHSIVSLYYSNDNNITTSKSDSNKKDGIIKQSKKVGGQKTHKPFNFSVNREVLAATVDDKNNYHYYDDDGVFSMEESNNKFLHENLEFVSSIKNNRKVRRNEIEGSMIKPLIEIGRKSFRVCH